MKVITTSAKAYIVAVQQALMQQFQPEVAGWKVCATFSRCGVLRPGRPVQILPKRDTIRKCLHEQQKELYTHKHNVYTTYIERTS